MLSKLACTFYVNIITICLNVYKDILNFSVNFVFHLRDIVCITKFSKDYVELTNTLVCISKVEIQYQ